MERVGAEAAVPDSDTGRYRRQNHFQGDYLGDEKRRYRKMLWRRYKPEAKTARKTKRRKEENEANWKRGSTAGSISGCVKTGRIEIIKIKNRHKKSEEIFFAFCLI